MQGGPAAAAAGRTGVVRQFLLPFLIVLVLLSGRAEAARIVVTIDGVHSTKGDV
jgi:hypothetical protein